MLQLTIDMGMPIDVLMKSHSERQLRLLLRKRKQDWQEPDRHDWYLMQIAALLQAMISKKDVKTETMKLKFKFKSFQGSEEPERQLTPHEMKIRRRNAAAAAKARWFGVAGPPSNLQ